MVLQLERPEVELVETLAAKPEIDFEREYTLEEFLELELPDDDIEYELWEGVIVARSGSGPSGEHGEIVIRLGQLVRNYLDENPIGRTYGEAACTLGQVLKKGSLTRPDFSFVAKGRTAEKFRGPIPVAPDLIAEVISPTDTLEDVHRKIAMYRNAGVKLLWNIYLLENFVIVYELDKPGARRVLLEPQDELTGGDVLPGFKVPVAKLFE
jgi:Uma2 family endonuclease